MPVQASAVSADLAVLAEHVSHLADLVVTVVGHDNANANTTLAVIGTVFLPLTFIAGGGGGPAYR
jgi:Mg2+ and Co2+ transporter CorA